MKGAKSVILLIIAFIILVEITYLVIKINVAALPGKYHSRKYAIHKELSQEYLNQGLYKEAIDSYEKYILNPELDDIKRSNISYIIGNIYMDNLADYKNALASFVRAKVFSPENPNISEIDKKVVTCLERLGRPGDAEREMSKITAIQKKEIEQTPKSKEQGIIIARLNDRNITMAELNGEIEKLPAPMREDYKKEGKKLEFLKQYIAGELLYDSAKRRGYDNGKDIIEAVYRLKRQLMIEKLLDEEIDSKLGEPTEMDLKLYYEAHKDKYTEEKKDDKGKVNKVTKQFDEVKDLVKSGYISEKRQESLNEFIEKLIETQKVEIYSDMFKKKD